MQNIPSPKRLKLLFASTLVRIDKLVARCIVKSANLLSQLGNFGQSLLKIILCLCVVFLSSCQNQAPNSSVIHITLWQGINPPVNRDVFEKLVDKFNQTHPDIYVESIFAGSLDLQLPKILTAVVGNVLS